MVENDTRQKLPRDEDRLKLLRDLLEESIKTGSGIYIDFETGEISRHPKVGESVA